MSTKILLALIFISMPLNSYAIEGHPADAHPDLFHAIRLETDIGAGREGNVTAWDLDGWIGGDYNKLWLKSEGDILEGESTERAEYWAMYSRNIAEFWDVQAGIRYDSQPYSASYLVVGFAGLAPYFFETEAHLFVSNEGDVSAHIRQENDFLITQKLITQPYIEINFSAQDVPEQEIGAGITSGEFGLQTRYEITRKFSPYIDIRYERELGETSAIAKKEGKNRDDFVTGIGLRLLF